MEITRLGVKFSESYQHRQLRDPKLVGEVYTSISTPSIQLTSANREQHLSDYYQGCTTSFQVTAVVTIDRVNVSRKIHLTGSATYTQTGYHKDSYYGYRHHNESGTVSVRENTTGLNSWTVIFNPPSAGNYCITFRVRGKYGDEDLHSEYSHRVYVNKPHLYDYDY